MNASGGDKKEVFRKYLEKTKVVSLLTKSLTDLFEMDSRPSEPIQFLAERFQKEAARLTAKAQASTPATASGQVAPSATPSAVSPPQKVPGSLKIKVPIRKIPHSQSSAASRTISPAAAEMLKTQVDAQAQVNATSTQPAAGASAASVQTAPAPTASAGHPAGTTSSAPALSPSDPPEAAQNSRASAQGAVSGTQSSIPGASSPNDARRQEPFVKTEPGPTVLVGRDSADVDQNKKQHDKDEKTEEEKAPSAGTREIDEKPELMEVTSEGNRESS